MATPKYRGLKLGPNNFNNKSFESEVFVEARGPLNGTAGSLDWSAGTTYGLGDAVLYEGLSYNSLILGNIGNQPDTSPTEWVLVDGKDGDVWIQTPAAGFPAGGSDAELYIKSAEIWRPLSGANPVTVALNDGQIALETAFEYPAGALPFAIVEYTVRRGSGHSRKRHGYFVILNDGGSHSETHEFEEIGADVNVPFSIDIFGGNVRLRYTSTLETSAIELRYSVKGWN